MNHVIRDEATCIYTPSQKFILTLFYSSSYTKTPNHDQPRVISRFAHDDPQHREASAKMIAVFHAFQAGTPFIYQGQEIGMTNVPKEWPIEEYKDIDCVNHWK
ncbi:hypothetical protein EWS82_13205 [Staphylococcus xylosus]|nr:hypothetical protein [Staphylococcus xylosus]